MLKKKNYVIRNGDSYFHGADEGIVNFYNSLQGALTFNSDNIGEALNALKEGGFVSVYKVRIKDRHQKSNG